MLFTTYVPSRAETRTFEDDFKTKMSAYKAVASDYEFTVEMYQKNAQNADELLGSGTYKPTKTIENAGTDTETVTYTADGSLEPTSGTTALYWPSSGTQYAFKATAGTDGWSDLATDQSTKEKFIAQDRLEGYAFEPLLNEDKDAQIDKENALNYRTLKEWYDANKLTQGLTPGWAEEATFYKKIPLYMQHKRSLITVILKADEGVERSALVYETAINNVNAFIYSYSGSERKDISAYGSKTTVNYVSSDYGEPEENVNTIQFSAVVEPYDYLGKPLEDVIAEIRVSGQRFTFKASNDDLYDKSTKEDAEAIAHMNNYNLEAGKHLVITALLGRSARKILITAYVEDWTDAIYSSIVDDYGQAGDPVQINNRQELLDFLQDDTKNKPGSVAIIVPGSIDLEKDGETDAAWPENIKLNCTLNMAGATFYTKHQIFSEIGASGNLVNGSVAVDNATVSSAVAQTNLGTIEHIDVMQKSADSPSVATRAGLVVTNSGTISGCTSELKVKAIPNFDGFVGGIAAESIYPVNGSTMPVIDGCTVNAKVDEADGEYETKGGGIVGQAEGRVTNNSFIYGISINQNPDRFKNIVQTKATSHDLRAYGNSWPTIAINTDTDNGIPETNTNGTPEAERYDAVIDCQSELQSVLTSATYNTFGKRYRLSDDFTVTNWSLGKVHDDPVFTETNGNVYFELDGNDKTITTDGMLFSNIRNNIYDLTVCLSANLISNKDNTNADVAATSMAALGYSVSDATLSNIKVKGGDYRIQAKLAGGLVVWAFGGAVIEDCQCKAKILIWTEDLASEAKTYAGGIVGCAAKATITRCVFHNTTEDDGSGTPKTVTLYRNVAETYNAETIVPETTAATGIFYGGILGASAPKGATNTEWPEVLITDCSSWFSTESVQNQKGAIVGYALYDNNGLVNGIKDGCQGNWWNGKGIGTYHSTMTIDQIIGKCNAVSPVADSNF